MGSNSTANIQLVDFSAVKEAEGPSGQGSGPGSLVLVCVLRSGPSTFLVYVLISDPFSFISLNLCSTVRSIHLHLSSSVFNFPRHSPLFVLVCVLLSGPSTLLVFVLLSGPSTLLVYVLLSSSVTLFVTVCVLLSGIFIFFPGSRRSTRGYESRRCMLFAGSSIM